MKAYKLPWYLNTIFIAILAAFSIFIIPGILAIVLTVKQQKMLSEFRKKIAEENRETAEFRSEVSQETLSLIDAKKELEKHLGSKYIIEKVDNQDNHSTLRREI